MKLIRKSAIYILFLAFGCFLIWWKYGDLDKDEIIEGLKQTNYFWIFVSIVLGILSHYSRAVRWKMLIKPLGYDPKVSNIFLSVFVMYFANLFIPRAGEVARCTILSKYEKIPATKLVGTMIVERIADTLTMLFLAVIIFIINLGVLKRFFEIHPEFGQNFVELLTLTNIFLGVAVIILLVVIVLLIRPDRNSKLNDLIKKVKVNLKEGVKSILKLENKWYFIFHTLFIFLMWLLMLYAIFLAYPPTAHLTIWTGMFTFLMGGLAMLMPIPAGTGSWHYMVIESLLLFGISKEAAAIFALIAHSTTNILIYIVLGILAFILFPILNRKYKPKPHHTNTI